MNISYELLEFFVIQLSHIQLSVSYELFIFWLGNLNHVLFIYLLFVRLLLFYLMEDRGKCSAWDSSRFGHPGWWGQLCT